MAYLARAFLVESGGKKEGTLGVAKTRSCLLLSPLVIARSLCGKPANRSLKRGRDNPHGRRGMRFPAMG